MLNSATAHARAMHKSTNEKRTRKAKQQRGTKNPNTITLWHVVRLFVSYMPSTHDRRHTYPRNPRTHMSFKWFLSHLGTFLFVYISFAFDHHSSFVKNFFLAFVSICVCARRFCFHFFNPYKPSTRHFKRTTVISFSLCIHFLRQCGKYVLVTLFCALFFSFDVVAAGDNTIGAVVEVWLQCLA